MKKISASYDDIIFENRNKEYGAYELRQLSDRYNAYGLSVTISAFVLLGLIYTLMMSRTPILHTPAPPYVVVKTTDLPQIIPQRPVLKHTVLPPPPTVPGTNNFGTIVPVETPETPTTVPTQTDLVNNPVASQPNTNTTSGTFTGEPDLPGTSSSQGSIEVDHTVHTWAPVMPSFIGGDKALKEYLMSHIKMNSIDIENGITGKVIVRFYVDTDGSVKDASVIKDTAGGHCAEIALAVIGKMPRWNPGKQNNTPVKVYYTVPIQFEVK